MFSLDWTFFKVCAKHFVKVNRIGKVMKRRPPSYSAIKIKLAKHLILIMRIVDLIREIFKHVGY